MTLRISYTGAFTKKSGYGRAMHDYLCALKTQSVAVQADPIIEANTDDLDPRYSHLLENLNDVNETHIVIHTIPQRAHEFITEDLKPRDGIKKVCVTTWETFKLPELIPFRLNLFDAVIVPSSFNQELFKQAGVRNVHMIPHTFDPAWWWQGEWRKDQTYTFYTIGVWSERKNPIGLLKAYLTEFRAGDPVKLVVIDPYFNEGDVQSLKRSIGFEEYPEIEHRSGLSDEEIRDCHRRYHCYVTTARAEGFGLGAFEAAIMGNFVIAPDHTGLNTALRVHNRWLRVGWGRTPAFAFADKIEGPTTTGITAEQMWTEPNLMDVRRHMRDCFQRGAASEVDVSNRETMKARYGIEKIGGEIVHLLNTI
jgi:glycosyltransferase involved in cell wall biosynthesis